MSVDFAAIFEADKSLVMAPQWVSRDSEGLEVVAPLLIDSVAVEGLLFRGTARSRLPDEVVTFQIELHPPAEPGGPLSRVEWRPLKAHNNKGLGPPEWQHRLMTGCHIHQFHLNMQCAPKELRKGRLPVAVPLAVSPINFQELLGFVGKEFKINNIGLLTVPPWAPTLV